MANYVFTVSKMEVEEPIGPRDIPKTSGRELPDYPTRNNTAVDAMAVHNATGSLDLIGQLALNEWETLRRKIRELGVKIRQMSSKAAAATVKRLWNSLLSLLRRHGDSIPRQYELDAAMILNEMEQAEEGERAPPRDTLADIRRVLLEDTEEEGVVQRRRAAAWREMPPARNGAARVDSPLREGDTSAYQLFNRPMTLNDDDFDRLSLPSGSAFAQSESEKILSLEAQLSLLTRQLNMIMSAGLPQQQAGGGGGAGSAQRGSRPVSRSHSRASLYGTQQGTGGGGGGGGQQMGMNQHGSYGGLLPAHHEEYGSHHQHHSSSSSLQPHHHPHRAPLPPQSPSLSSSPSEGEEGVYMNHSGSSSWVSAIPPAPPLPPLLLGLQQPQMQQLSTGASRADVTSPLASSSTLLQLGSTSATSSSSSLDDYDIRGGRGVGAVEEGGDGGDFSSPPASPLPPPPKELLAARRRESVQPSASAAAPRSFLDDISSRNFALRKTSSEKSPTDSRRSATATTSGEETEEHDENSMGQLVRPTANQLLSRKVSLKRISADRSPGGTPQTRGRRRPPSLGPDGGKSLYTGDYLAAALAKQFNTIHVNEEDDDQSVTAGDQSWLDD